MNTRQRLTRRAERYVLSSRLVLAVLVLCAAASAQELSGDVLIFHAGSLAAPFREIADAFMDAHPGVRVWREAAGSRDSARKLSDLGRACDVLASADYRVIDSLLIPEHAAWNLSFAGNEMVLAYNDHSKYAAELNRQTWPHIVLRDDVRFGRSDPNADPCGYRTLLTAKLAEKHYALPVFADTFVQKDRRFIRPKETDLLALLEVGVIDYVFIYRSVAEQHGLRWLALPDAINLKRAEKNEHYASVSVEISGAVPGTTMTQSGEAMVYGVTIPHNAPNPDAALAFVVFLLEQDKGLAIMTHNGQPGLVPSVSTTYAHIPPPLQRYAREP